MKYFFIPALFLTSCMAAASSPRPPLASGTYTFKHKFAEHPTIPSITVIAKIRGRHIKIINNSRYDVFPKGVIAEGILMWHPESRQWIIGQKDSGRYLRDVGGCSDGPEVVDLKQKIYWTC